MRISQNCLDIIRKWEGYRTDAYLDPVGIPTIGYGTIKYPDGRKVSMGEKVTKAQAEEYLAFEVDKVVKALATHLKNVAVNQNQFDAIVSLCYNIGVGGFSGSTILKKLKAGDLAAAAAGFDLWNKGTVKGVKKVLPGLTNRRREERALFEKAGPGGDPIAVPNMESGVAPAGKTPETKKAPLTILKKGSQGRDVSLWQTFLNTQGIGVTVDGDFGPKTVKATKAYQKQSGIGVDGEVGPKTIKSAVKHGFKGFEANDSNDKNTIVKAVEATPVSHLNIFTGLSKVDQINAAKLAGVCPALQSRGQKFIEAAAADGVIVQIVQGLRTFAEQDELFKKGRTKPGKRVTNARGGQSNHNFGLALDFAPVVGGKVSWDEKLYRPFGKWAAAAGLSWGGNWTKFKDLPHVEYLKGHSLAQIQELYRKGGLSMVWSAIK